MRSYSSMYVNVSKCEEERETPAFSPCLFPSSSPCSHTHRYMNCKGRQIVFFVEAAQFHQPQTRASEFDFRITLSLVQYSSALTDFARSREKSRVFCDLQMLKISPSSLKSQLLRVPEFSSLLWVTTKIVTHISSQGWWNSYQLCLGLTLREDVAFYSEEISCHHRPLPGCRAVVALYSVWCSHQHRCINWHQREHTHTPTHFLSIR